MALVVEDGTALPNADGFISYADASTYINDRGLVSPQGAAWPAVQATGEQLIRQATDFMEGYYRLLWKGKRVSEAQALSWPRFSVTLDDIGYTNVGGYQSYGMFYVSNTIVPPQVKTACADLALIAVDGPLAPVIKRLAKSIKLDVLQKEYEADATPFTIFRSVNMKLQPFLQNSPGNIQLQRR